MKILIFTCLCQRATHCRNVAFHPLQMLLVLSASNNEGKDVFLQLKTWHNITPLSGGKGQKDEEKTGPPRLGSARSKALLIGHWPHCHNSMVKHMKSQST